METIEKRLEEAVIFNAAGTCKLAEEFEALLPALPAVMVGSFTKEKRLLNVGDTYWTEMEDNNHTPLFSLNSLGLPNPGFDYYRKYLPLMAKLAHSKGKMIGASVSVSSPDNIEEFGEGIELALSSDVDFSEINLGCPNVMMNDNTPKRVLCYSPELVREVVGIVLRRTGQGHAISFKLSYTPDAHLLREIIEIMREHNVWGLSLINALANGVALDPETGKTRTAPGGGLAGLAGPAIKPVALGMVKQVRTLLPKIFIFGMGGVDCGWAVKDFKVLGANATMANTAFSSGGANSTKSIFNKILQQFAWA